MDRASLLRRAAAVSALAAFTAVPAFMVPALAADPGNSVDVGTKVPDLAAVREGLFPEDACKELQENGFKCMGIKPAIRYSLPAASFKLGSAELPDLLKKQLDVFADAMRGRKSVGREVQIVGHADASGTAEANQSLSVRRAEAVKDYLVKKGAEPGLLVVNGVGSNELLNPANPLAAENRRVQIGRQPMAQ